MARRYVTQHHTAAPEGDHFDIMLDRGDSLATWRAPVALRDIGDKPVAARRIADHRRAYLDYEGPVSNGRGDVRIVERGEFTTTGELTADEFVLHATGAGEPAAFEFTRASANRWRIRRVPGPSQSPLAG